MRGAVVRVEFPMPIRLVSEANQHEHWRVRAKRAKSQRAAARLIATAWTPWVHGDVRFSEGPIAVTITRVAPRALDSDNAVGSAKAVRDGIADALGVNDGSPRVEWRYGQRRGGVGEYGVDVVIEERVEG